MKFENLSKFIRIELAPEIYTTEKTPSLVSNAISKTQFRSSHTKIQQFYESWFLNPGSRNSSIGVSDAVSKSSHK